MIRVAILGGGIGSQHLEAYQALPEFDVSLIIDQDTDRCKTFKKQGIVTGEDIDLALGSDADLIDICLPPHMHAPVILQALAAGKHVICEKPLATSLAQVAAIKHAAAVAEKHVFPVFQYRFGPAFDRLNALRAAGLTGTPIAASLETHWNRGPDYYAIPWRGTWAGEQGGAVLGHAIHAHDLLGHLMGPIRAVTARLGTLVNDIETDDTAAIIFELEGGALATSSITLGSGRDDTRIRMVYEHLTATSGTNPYAPAEDVWDFVARNAAQQNAVDEVIKSTPRRPSGFTGFLSEVANALLDRSTQAVSLDEGAASIELVTAIYASHRSGQSVSLPLPPDHPMQQGWLP